MPDLDDSDRSQVDIRSSTLKVLEAISTVRRQHPHEVLDDIVEQHRAKLWPDPKPPTSGRGKGGRKPAERPTEHTS